MTHHVVVGILLAAAVLVVVASVAGVVTMRDVYQRAHFLGPMTMLAPLLIAVAVTISSGWDENTGQTWLALGFVIVVSPFLSHATVRAARIREQGDWRSTPARRSKREEEGR